MQKSTSIQTSIATWLTFANSAAAAEFYKTAFGAVETYRMEDPGGGLVLKLSVDGAEFWLSGGNAGGNSSPMPFTNDNFRMILTVGNPDEMFNKALAAGAAEVFPIGEDYGWRLGRLVDPFGLHWEIGHPL